MQIRVLGVQYTMCNEYFFNLYCHDNNLTFELSNKQQLTSIPKTKVVHKTNTRRRTIFKSSEN